MNKGQLVKLLEGFNDDTEIRIGGWTENNSGGYNYKDVPLEERHINPETTPNTGKTVIMLDTE